VEVKPWNLATAMVYSVYSSSVGFLKLRLGKHEALSTKSRDWLAQNQNNVSKWSDMSTRRLLFQ
jgi:hypothetical protein